jgi:hypothetical protein
MSRSERRAEISGEFLPGAYDLGRGGGEWEWRWSVSCAVVLCTDLAVGSSCQGLRIGKDGP